MNRKLRSKFSFLGILVALIITAMAPFIFYMSLTSPAAGLLIPTLYVFVVLYFWLTEFRTRAHWVVIEDRRISVRKYFGLGKSVLFRYSDFKGFITSQQPGRMGPKEYIFLIRNDKRAICISQFYHSNYPELKAEIEQKLPFLGEKEYNFGYEYKQMFR